MKTYLRWMSLPVLQIILVIMNYLGVISLPIAVLLIPVYVFGIACILMLGFVLAIEWIISWF